MTLKDTRILSKTKLWIAQYHYNQLKYNLSQILVITQIEVDIKRYGNPTEKNSYAFNPVMM